MAALRIFRSTATGAAGGPRPWQANPAALRLLAEHGIAVSALQVLAGDPMPQGAGQWCPPGASKPWAMWSTALEDGLLLWLQPPPADEADAVAEPLPDAPASTLPPVSILSLAQAHGRVGLFMREIDSGRGWWDPQVFHIMGLPETAQAPLLQSVISSRLHPDEREEFLRRNAEHKQRLGRGDIRFRIVHDDGQVRHLHSIFEVMPATPQRPAMMMGVLIDDTEAAEVLRAHRDLSSTLRLALEMADASVWRIDPSLQFVHCEPQQPAPGVAVDAAPSPPAAVLAGQPAGLSLQTLHGRLHPDDEPALLAAVSLALASGQVVEVVSRHGDDVSGWRSLLTRRVRQQGADGQVQGLLGVSIDVTALAEAQDLSSRLADRMHLAAETVGLGFWSINGDTGERQWDASMFRLYHRDPAEPTPSFEDFLLHFVHAQDRQRLLEHVNHHQSVWTDADALVFRTVTGGQATPRWIQSRARRGVQQGQRMVWGVDVDVTDLHLAQAALEQERQRTSFALASAGVGVWELRLDEGASYLCPQALRLRGLDPDSRGDIKELAAQVCAPQELERSNAAIRRHVEEGTPYALEFAVRWPDGSEHWLASFGQVQRDEQGRALMVAGINVDVTARRRAEALAQDMQALEQSNLAKSDFLSRMSHELRTPLNAVLGFAQLMRQDSASPLMPRQLHQLQRIESAGRELLAMVEDMLTSSRRALLVVPEADNAGHRPAPAPGAALRLRLMCVEDNPVNALLLRELLEMRPAVHYMICADARSALAAAADFAPDAFVLDLQLPDMPGGSLMRKLKSDVRHAQSRFIALSADAMPGQVQAARAAGFDAYWTKPIDVREFLSELDDMVHLLRQRQTRPPIAAPPP